MMKFCVRIILLWTVLLVSFAAKAQVYTNDFENQQEWNLPWFNLHIVADSSDLEVNHVCICDTIHEYGFGVGINAGKEFPNQNINCKLGFLCKADTDTQADIVVSIDDTIRNRYWVAYPLANYLSDTIEWNQVQLDFNFPACYTQGSEIKIYVWNKSQEKLIFDDAQLVVREDFSNNYLPPVTNNSMSQYTPHKSLSPYLIPILEYIDANGDTLNDPSVMETTFHDYYAVHDMDPHSARLRHGVTTETTFKKDIKLLRLGFILPLPEGKLTVYRRNQHIDTTNFQKSYYLDREGFSIQSDSLILCTYHNLGISSLQLNTEDRIACFNINYWRDHPLLHYPMRSDTSDFFEDISYRIIHKGDTLKGTFEVYNFAMADLPRIMPVWDGYQSAFILTEHADWTDLRTHRAVLFGNENITKPEDAVGGFCYFNIPVTKSVFYWNPDNVTNEKTSGGRFTGLCASIKTDKAFYKLLKTLKKE